MTDDRTIDRIDAMTDTGTNRGQLEALARFGSSSAIQNAARRKRDQLDQARQAAATPDPAA